MLALFAQGFFGGSVGHLALAIVLIAAVFAIVMIAVRAMGLNIPQWFWQIIMVIVVAVVAILAIKFVMSL